MNTWLSEDERPLGLGAGDSISWQGLHLTRVTILGPNWHYRVVAGEDTFHVNVFKPNQGVHRIRIRGTPRSRDDRGVYIVEDLDVAFPEEALVQALTRVRQIVQEKPSAK